MKLKVAVLSAALLLASAAWAQIKIDPVVPDVKAVESPTGDKVETRIAKEVRHELLMIPYYSLFDDLGFIVHGHNVELIGAVNDGTVASEAVSAVKHIEGVEKVTNNIKLLPPIADDVRIRREVFRSLMNTANLSQYFWEAAPSIHILVENGHIRLLGYVDNESDKNMANIAASGVPGAFGVQNDLQVLGGEHNKKKK